MTRPLIHLALAALLALGLIACDSKGGPAPTMERVNAVKVTPQQAQQAPAVPQGWCDSEWPQGSATAPTLKLTGLEALSTPAAPALVPADRYVWINFWATWCKPCVHELPILLRWNQALQNEHVPFDLWTVSIDEEKDVLASYLKAHPELALPHSWRLAKVDDLAAILTPYGLASGASVPIQMLVAPGGKLRCVRAGSISDADYPILRALIGR